MTDRNGKLSITLSNALYSLMATGLLLCGIIYSFAGGPGEGFGYYLYALLSEAGVVALPALLCIIYVPPIRRRFKKSGISVFQVVLIFIATIIGLFFIAMISELWGIFIVRGGGEMRPQNIPSASGAPEFLSSLITIALAPALCEELLVRGVMLPSYERLGKRTAVLLSGILFAILHGNIMALPGHFILGAVLGYLVMETNSIAAGIVYHFAHNGISLAITYFGSGISSGAEPLIDMYNRMQGDELTMYITGTVIAALILGLIYYAFIRWIRRISRKRLLPDDSIWDAPDVLDLPDIPNSDEMQGMTDIPDIAPRRIGVTAWLPLLPGLLIAGYLYWFDFMATFFPAP